MLVSAVKSLLRHAGFELRRLPDPALPRIHHTQFDDQPISLWLANSDTAAWWGKPVIPLNAEYRALKQLSAVGDVVLDVGGHHGMTSIPFSRWVGPTGRVHSFEANPFNALVLQANCGLNRTTNIDVVHSAVGSRVDVITIAGESVDGAGGQPQAVPMIPLDDFCAERQIHRVQLLKVDVEGYEYEVFRGAQRILAQKPKIALELHLDLIGRFGATLAQIDEVLGLSRGAYAMTAMMRPNWDELKPLASISELPTHGVVNLFLQPRS